MPNTTATQTAWPEGVIARYLNLGGGTADITDKGEESYWRYAAACTGCPATHETNVEDFARTWAQSHAEKCRAMPRPVGA
ncbi:hypothetical protein [Streptomyces kronopolitis]|uniref:hypothetical protein n=1 Tax=Streptomyces kronopolitis TaxID=1612435 RepID=UPI0020BF541D|nr:hypothetical protein [Streptomyces kronopolitis]MCL6300497.1 hypothetical protein [Streptomyces kronopolitis]